MAVREYTGQAPPKSSADCLYGTIGVDAAAEGIQLQSRRSLALRILVHMGLDTLELCAALLRRGDSGLGVDLRSEVYGSSR
jgi:hypothetical protein